MWVYCFDIIWHILLKLSVKLQALQINIYINIFIFINRYLRNQFLNVTFIYHRVRLVFKLIIEMWEKRRQDFYVQTLLYHSTQHCNKHDSSMTSVSFYPLDIIELLNFEKLSYSWTVKCYASASLYQYEPQNDKGIKFWATWFSLLFMLSYKNRHHKTTLFKKLWGASMSVGDMYCLQYSQDAFDIKHYVDICQVRRDKPCKLHMFIGIHCIFNTWPK